MQLQPWLCGHPGVDIPSHMFIYLFHPFLSIPSYMNHFVNPWPVSIGDLFPHSVNQWPISRRFLSNVSPLLEEITGACRSSLPICCSRVVSGDTPTSSRPFQCRHGDPYGGLSFTGCTKCCEWELRNLCIFSPKNLSQNY